jgi:hypothetical protein
VVIAVVAKSLRIILFISFARKISHAEILPTARSSEPHARKIRSLSPKFRKSRRKFFCRRWNFRFRATFEAALVV